VIGQKLCGDTIAKTAINAQHHANWHDAAKAIMTTDTFPKGAARQVTVSDGSKISFSGIAKGSGMIAPHMGTMLAFIFTDAHILQSDLQRILCDISDKTFNSITVDGDTSTSDSLQVFATAAAQKTPLTGTDLDIFADGLNEICKDLALQIVMDGEGISKFIKITVADAKTNESARKIGLSIANSPLVKTAIAGQDANWGRIIMAIGKSGEPADRDKTSVSMGGVTIAKDGEAVDAYDETPVATHMKGQYIDIHVSVGVGTGTADVYTTDLTHRYIDINADYRS
jgi:glutamate N-acetyltransferase/amino-acid N-acetyltransferase